jgi:hypothetical protein
MPKSDNKYKTTNLTYHIPKKMTAESSNTNTNDPMDTPLTQQQFYSWLASTKLDRVTLPKYNENTDSIRPWLQQYETLVNEQKIPLNECLTHVRKFLPTRIQTYINNLPPAQRSSWTTLSTALLDRFATTKLIDDSDIWNKVCKMQQKKQPFHLYATDWQNEITRMSSQKPDEELVERFITSLADDRLIGALATVTASTTNCTLNDIIASGLKIDRTINGLKNTAKDSFYHQHQFNHQPKEIETMETSMDADGDTVMGTNKLKYHKHGKSNKQEAKPKSQDHQQRCRFCKNTSHTHDACFSRKNPNRNQRAENYQKFKNKKAQVHGIKLDGNDTTKDEQPPAKVNHMQQITHNSALDEMISTNINTVQQRPIVTTSLPHCHVTINNQQVLAMLDSGAEISIMCDKLCNQLELTNMIDHKDCISYQPFNTTTSKRTIGSITVKLFQNTVKFNIIHSTDHILILGVDVLRQLNMTWNWQQQTVSFNSKHTSNTTPLLNEKGTHFINNITMDMEINAPTTLRHELLELLYHYKTIIPASNKRPNVTKLLECDIELKPDATPIFVPPRQYPPTLQKILNEEMELLTELGICTKTGPSEWGSMASLVKKPDGTYRVVGDYRQLNQRTVIKKGIHVNLQTALTSLGTATIFSKLDLASGYWQVPIKPSDRIKTALTTTSGIYYFNVMPFGLVNAPYIFQHLMNLTLGSQQFTHCISYLDDIIIYSSNPTIHMQHLVQVFDALEKANLSIKLSKCAFGMEKIEYLGFMVSSAGIQPNKDKIAPILSLKHPTTLKELESFLGMVGVYSRFIGKYSIKTEPLRLLKRKGQQFIWTQQQQLKWELQHLPTLRQTIFYSH